MSKDLLAEYYQDNKIKNKKQKLLKKIKISQIRKRIEATIWM